MKHQNKTKKRCKQNRTKYKHISKNIKNKMLLQTLKKQNYQLPKLQPNAGSLLAPKQRKYEP